MAERQRGHRCEACVFCGRCLGISDEREKAAAKPKSFANSFAVLKRGDGAEELDATTGATPGVSSACSEYGLDDIQTVLRVRGIKPPGVC